MKHKLFLKIPTGGRLTSWLFRSKAGGDRSYWRAQRRPRTHTGIPTIKKQTGDRYVSEPPREQLQIGPLRKKLHTGTVRIETHQSQPTTVIQMVTRNQSTSSPDED